MKRARRLSQQFGRFDFGQALDFHAPHMRKSDLARGTDDETGYAADARGVRRLADHWPPNGSNSGWSYTTMLMMSLGPMV